MLGKVAFLVMCVTVSGFARADEQMRTLLVSGPWVVRTHASSMLAQPDMCLVINVESSVALRKSMSYDDLEFRVIDDRWSLPSDVKASMLVEVGSWSKNLYVDFNTSTMISAPVLSIDVAGLFAAMDKSSVMTITMGSAKPLRVSLAGSSRATNAFRTCAHIQGNEPSDGSNPFR